MLILEHKAYGNAGPSVTFDASIRISRFIQNEASLQKSPPLRREARVG